MAFWAVTGIALVLAVSLGVSGQVRYPCNEFSTDEVVLLNHATSCSQYVMCFSGEAVIRSCAPGLTFDVEDGHCKEDAKCDVEDRVCPPYDDPSHLIFHPNPDFCDQFSLCLNGEPLNRSCSVGLHWDRENSWCNFPDEANCPVRIDCPLDGVHYFPHPEDCRRYFVCLWGSLQVAECADGLIFDIFQETCFFEDQSTCVTDTTEAPEVSICYGALDNSRIVNPENCNEYFICNQGEIAVTVTCPEGYVFANYDCFPGNIETCEIDE